MQNNILEIKNITISLIQGSKQIQIVRDVSLDIKLNRMVGLVGESGSGKTMTALSIFRLLPQFIKITGGKIIFNNNDLLSLNEKELRKIRGKEISLITQEPLTGLNPSFRIGWQMYDVIRAHPITFKNKVDSFNLIKKTLDTVKIKQVEKIIFQYPYQLSGGMRQRVVIGMSVLLNPKLIIADEPTTALDVTTQKEIFELFTKLKKQFNFSFLIISHDLNLISEVCDEIYIMYCGQIVEKGKTTEIFNNPLHPYTKGLLGCIPNFEDKQKNLNDIEGDLPNVFNYPKGCSFYKRCKYKENKCESVIPVLKEISESRAVRCLII